MACFFDIETDGLHNTARITCAATWNQNGATVWHSNYKDYMTIADLTRLIDFLCQQEAVVTFNGANFDFRVLYFCTLDERVPELAKKHIDICLCFGVSKGYFGSLDSFMQGCNIPGKSGSGGNAIDLWLHGDQQSKDGILNYCKNDVRCLKDLYIRMCTQRKNVYRRTKAGKRQKWIPKLVSVQDALKAYSRAPPDVSWMTNAPKIGSVLDWVTCVPPIALAPFRTVLPDQILQRCARGASNISEFEAMVAEEVYARHEV